MCSLPDGLAAATEAIKSYRPLPHRCEPVAERAGVTFINDSKATNLDALAKALESATQPVVLIAGGKDKGFGYEPLRDLAGRKVKRAGLIGEMSYGDTYRLVYIRGPEGIIVALAEQLGQRPERRA